MVYKKCYICGQDTNIKKNLFRKSRTWDICSSCNLLVENRIHIFSSLNLSKLPKNRILFLNKNYVEKQVLEKCVVEMLRKTRGEEEILDFLFNLNNGSLSGTSGMAYFTNTRLRFFTFVSDGIGTAKLTGLKTEYSAALSDILNVEIKKDLLGNQLIITDKGNGFKEKVYTLDIPNTKCFIKKLKTAAENIQFPEKQLSANMEKFRKLKELMNSGVYNKKKLEGKDILVES